MVFVGLGILSFVILGKINFLFVNFIIAIVLLIIYLIISFIFDKGKLKPYNVKKIRIGSLFGLLSMICLNIMVTVKSNNLIFLIGAIIFAIPCFIFVYLGSK